eukprot:m51a1_g1042 hypothetical protein (471) ;mRNA; r:732253-736151
MEASTTAPVALILSSHRARVVCDSQWLSQHHLGREAIRASCARAAVRIEGDEHGPNLGPCARCCGGRLKKLVAIQGSGHEEPAAEGSGQRVFVFGRNCNTSRLHAGGRVVVVVMVWSPLGPLAEAVSAPLTLVSRSSYVKRARDPLAAQRITWTDCSEHWNDGGLSAHKNTEQREHLTASSDPAVTSPGAWDDLEAREQLLWLLVLQIGQLERVTVVCDSQWMREHRLGAEAIRAAYLGPCARCCGDHHQKLVAIQDSGLEQAAAETGGRCRAFVFGRCTTNCNTSRLHLGGRVVLVVTVGSPMGSLAEAVSAPLTLVSRSSYARRARVPLAAHRIRWTDCSEYWEARGAAAVADTTDNSPVERPDEKDEQRSSGNPGPQGMTPGPCCWDGHVHVSEEAKGMLLALAILQGQQLCRVRALEQLDTRVLRGRVVAEVVTVASEHSSAGATSNATATTASSNGVLSDPSATT